MNNDYGNDDPLKSRIQKREANEGLGNPLPPAMAIARPVRVLTIVSGLLFFYLVFQIFKMPPRIRGPGDLEQEMPNEPMLIGITTLLLGRPKLTISRDERTPRAPVASG